MNRARSGRLSTVVPTFTSIRLDRLSPDPLYRQVEDQLRTAIQTGRLRPGARLPGIRTLAIELGVARVTVASAYEELAAEGYLAAQVGSGTRVADEPPGRPPELDLPEPARRQPQSVRIDLRLGAVPSGSVPGVFPSAAWESRLRRAWREGTTGSPPGPAGVMELRIALGAYLDAGRGTRSDPRRIVIGHGARVLVAALVAALDAEGGPSRIPVLGLLEPTDPDLRTVARRSGATTLDVPVERAAVHAAAGVVLVEDDRMNLLRLAGPPDAALQGSLGIGRIALIGGLDPLVVPDLSIAWIVLPGALAEPVAAALADLDGSPSATDQRVVAGWIADGGLDRRVRRLRQVLLSRRSGLIAALIEELGSILTLDPTRPNPVVSGQLHLDPGASAGLVTAARSVGLLIDPPEPDGRIVLAYGALEEDGPVKAAWRLGRAIDAVDPGARDPSKLDRSAQATRPLLRTVGNLASLQATAPAPSRLDALGRALGGRRGPAAEP